MISLKRGGGGGGVGWGGVLWLSLLPSIICLGIVCMYIFSLWQLRLFSSVVRILSFYPGRPGSNPTISGKFFQLCFIPFIRLYCRKNTKKKHAFSEKPQWEVRFICHFGYSIWRGIHSYKERGTYNNATCLNLHEPVHPGQHCSLTASRATYYVRWLRRFWSNCANVNNISWISRIITIYNVQGAATKNVGKQKL